MRKGVWLSDRNLRLISSLCAMKIWFFSKRKNPGISSVSIYNKDIFYPLRFFICSDFLAYNYRDQNLPVRKFQPEKKVLPKKSRWPFQGKNPLKMGNYTIFYMFENPRRGRQARNFTTNVAKILDLKSSSEQIFSENGRWVPLANCLTYTLGLPIQSVSHMW